MKIITEQQLRNIIRNVIKETVDEINLYHGTNADFDKFDVAYMSTGWGKQAYGYGFYLTTSYDAAKDYAYDNNKGQVMEVEVPDGKYLNDKSISQKEADRIARIFFKYMTEENPDTIDSYPDKDTKQAFWDYEVDYVRRCSTGCYVYNTIASLMGDYKDTSNFLHDKCGYVGLKIHDEYSNEKNTPVTYVIFKPNDIKILKKNVLKENIGNNPNTKLYHVVTRKRLGEGQNVVDLCHMVYRNGLTPFNNGEAGNCIWFWVNEPFYKDKNMIVVSLDYTPENKNLFEIHVDTPNAWAHKTIPFEYLNIESAPWVLTNNGNTMFYNKLNSGCHDSYAKFFNRWSKTNFETIDKTLFPWTVYTDVLPEEFLNLIPKNDNRFKFDKLFK